MLQPRPPLTETDTLEATSFTHTGYPAQVLRQWLPLAMTGLPRGGAAFARFGFMDGHPHLFLKNTISLMHLEIQWFQSYSLETMPLLAK